MTFRIVLSLILVTTLLGCTDSETKEKVKIIQEDIVEIKNDIDNIESSTYSIDHKSGNIENLVGKNSELTKNISNNIQKQLEPINVLLIDNDQKLQAINNLLKPENISILKNYSYTFNFIEKVAEIIDKAIPSALLSIVSFFILWLLNKRNQSNFSIKIAQSIANTGMGTGIVFLIIEGMSFIM